MFSSHEKYWDRVNFRLRWQRGPHTSLPDSVTQRSVSNLRGKAKPQQVKRGIRCAQRTPQDHKCDGQNGGKLKPQRVEREPQPLHDSQRFDKTAEQTPLLHVLEPKSSSANVCELLRQIRSITGAAVSQKDEEETRTAWNRTTVSQTTLSSSAEEETNLTSGQNEEQNANEDALTSSRNTSRVLEAIY